MAFGEIQAQYMAEMDNADNPSGLQKHQELISALTRIADAQEHANRMLENSLFSTDPIHDQLVEYIEKNRKVTMIIGAMNARIGFPRLIDHGVLHLQDDKGRMVYVRIKEIQAISEAIDGREED